MGATSSSRRTSAVHLQNRSLSATLLLSQYDEPRAFFQLVEGDCPDQKVTVALNNYGQIDEYFVSQISPADMSGGPGPGFWLCSVDGLDVFFRRLIEVADLPIRNLYLQNIDLSLHNEGKYEDARCMLKSVGCTVKNLYVDGVFGCQRELRDVLINAIGSEEIEGLQMTNADLAPDVPELVLKWIERGLWRHIEIFQVDGCEFTTTFLEAVLAWWDRVGGGMHRRLAVDLRITLLESAQFGGTTEWIRRGRALGSSALIRRHGRERFEVQFS
ncbi:hypothetical protein QR680_016704 [Steinernema hermaphroditum]|uniref:Uncharacterized protein n=1 Tax=Steinernema hermaphroditum TaxID=289476 RepID=A0AA39HD55_9BILA|nr:hypothetical protein QR680_016704 [Steinernema hermaphroditum]